VIYVYVILITFLALYSYWATGTVICQVIWFVMIYGSFAAIAIIQLLKGRLLTIWSIVTLIMLFLSIRELLCINMTIEHYTETRSGPPAYTLGVIAVVLYLFWLISKNIKWKHGVKELGK